MLAYPDFNAYIGNRCKQAWLGSDAVSIYWKDQKLHPVAYVSRLIPNAEANYSITDLETLAVVWADTHFWYCLYSHNVTIIMDHAAVKAILESLNLSGRHARLWSKVYGSGIKHIDIVHHAGRKNLHANCLSRQPVMPAPSDEDANTEVQIALISCEPLRTVESLL